MKRVTLVDMESVDAEGFVRKIGHVDLMAIRDPRRIARQRGDRPQGAPDDVITSDLLEEVYGVRLPVATIEGKPFVLAV